MTKEKLVAVLAEKTGSSKAAAKEFIEAFTETVIDTLASGDKLQIVGFGTFEPRERKERECVNPQTKEKMVVPATVAPVFKASKAFKAVVGGKA